MNVPFAIGPLAEVCATLARTTLGLPDALDGARLGAVELRTHQRVAVARARRALDDFGGALLADAVGLGKTYVALALVRDAHAPLVVAPAALRPTWLRAAAVAGVAAPIRSTESLSRAAARASRAPPPDLIVVDEAHHFRNPATRRWRHLADLAAHARVLLITATPIHNRAADLATLLSLFLGARAHTLDEATLARLVVRRRAADVDNTAADVRTTAADVRPAAPLGLPRVARARWHRLAADPTLYAALRALPPPVPPRDGGAADALTALTLARLWTSSDAALSAALRRRLARATALEVALADGRYLSRGDLRAWCGDAASVQCTLALLDESPHAPTTAGVPRGAGPSGGPRARAALHTAIVTHAAALRALLGRLEHAAPRARDPTARSNADAARVSWLRGLRARHPGARLVAFTQFADTARALFRALAPDGHVGLLTARGGQLASGPISRRDLLARFAPLGAGTPPPRAIERIDLLVATDCVSEGLDMRDASVVAHVDLPWTPARLAQRVGRAARLGAPHDLVHVYGLLPPPDVARWLRAERRLRDKARTAGRTLGAAPRSAVAAAPAASRLWIDRVLERWATAVADRDHADHSVHHGVAATVHAGRVARPDIASTAAPPAADTFGLLAVCVTPRGPHLVASLDGRPVTDAPRTLARAVRIVHRARRTAERARAGSVATLSAPDSCAADARALADALRRTRAWLRRHRTASLLAVRASPAVRATLDCAADLLRRTPSHHRAARIASVGALRTALGGHTTAGVERALAALLPSPADDAWLAAALAVANSPAASAAAHPIAPANDCAVPDCAPRLPRWHVGAIVLIVP